MIVRTINWPKPIRAFGILSTIITDNIIFHLFIVEYFVGWMHILELRWRKVWNDIFVVNHSECVGDNQMEVSCQISISDSRTSININFRNLRSILPINKEIWIMNKILVIKASAPPRLWPVIDIFAVGYWPTNCDIFSWAFADTDSYAFKNPSCILQLTHLYGPM